MSIIGGVILAGVYVLCAYQVKYGGARSFGLKVSVGHTATDFTLQDLSGRTWSLTKLRGTNVVIDFWATWCGPCKVSMPHLQRFYDDMRESNVVVLAISLDETNGSLAQFANDKHLTFPILWDREHLVADQYGVQAIPTTILIGPEGTVRHIEQGLNPYLSRTLKWRIEQNESPPSRSR